MSPPSQMQMQMQMQDDIKQMKTRMSKYDDILSALTQHLAKTDVLIDAIHLQSKEFQDGLSSMITSIVRLEERNANSDRIRTLFLSALGIAVPCLLTVLGWLVITHF